jgi:hypothetical protein
LIVSGIDAERSARSIGVRDISWRFVTRAPWRVFNFSLKVCSSHRQMGGQAGCKTRSSQVFEKRKKVGKHRVASTGKTFGYLFCNFRAQMGVAEAGGARYRVLCAVGGILEPADAAGPDRVDCQATL